MSPLGCNEHLCLHSMHSTFNSWTMAGRSFLRPSLAAGGRYRFEFMVESKPGRMYYFIGAAPCSKDPSSPPFDPMASQLEIRRRSAAVENLYGGLHEVGRPSMSKGLPCFHAGSKVAVEFDLLSWTMRVDGLVDGQTRTCKLRPAPEGYACFVSLYNRGAAFRIVRAEQA